MNFTHLQVHSGYSFFESTLSINTLVEKAKELQFTALALTDHEVLYGVIPFYKACIKHSIKPIIGMTVDVFHAEEVAVQCILLAKNNDGYQQLLELSTWVQGNDEKLSFDRLSFYGENLVCILPVLSSPLASDLMTNHFTEADQYIAHWLEVFPKEQFYLGVSDHGLAEERQLLERARAYAEHSSLQSVAIQDVRYLEKEDYVAYDCFQTMKKNQRWTSADITTQVQNRHLRSTEEMYKLFAEDWPDLIETTKMIQEQCTVSLSFDQSFMPSYPTPEGKPAHKYLEQLCWIAAEEKYESPSTRVKEQLTYELEIIQTMGFSDYFLIVWDFVTYAKQKNVMVGPGRGSAAGSLVAYLLNITEVDPLTYGLLFERFLNPERLVMPDIDIDFSDVRRDEVIDYVRKKFGDDYVAQIITFGTFGSRSLLRELFKTMGIERQDATYLLNQFPVGSSQSILEGTKRSNDLRTYIKQSSKLRLLFRIAVTLEGLPRHISTHAAGVVISKEPLLQHTPLVKGVGGENVTQYPMDDLESLGLLKMDFLGLKNLTFIERIMMAIEEDQDTRISIHDIPLRDEETFRLLQEGRTNGVFQLESQGMKGVLKALKPSEFEDIVAVNALYRPGPMDAIEIYMQRKHGREKVTFIHPDLEPILARTYGVLVYQEQMIEIVHKVSGYTYGEADLFRRKLENADEAITKELQATFLRESVNNGYEQGEAQRIFTWFTQFSRYSFNRSHSVAYSKISYWLAYFKANYPVYFFTELLNTVRQQREKISEYLKEMNQQGIKVLPPSVNHSKGSFTVEKNAIRMGLMAIKGIRPKTVEEIIQVREQRPFKSLFDFCLRVSEKAVQRKELELFILAGAFDVIYQNRASLLASVDQALEQRELFGDLYERQNLLTDRLGISAHYADIEDFPKMYKLQEEKELLGIYVSSHPLEEYRKDLMLNGYESLLHTSTLIGKRNIKSVAIIQEVRQIQTKHGDPMAFLVIGDETTDVDAVVFPALFERARQWLVKDKMVFITGEVQKRNDKEQWVLSAVEPFHKEKMKPASQKVFIKVRDHRSPEILAWIRSCSVKYAGRIPVLLYHEQSGKTYQLSSTYHVNANPACLRRLEQYFGKENVVVTERT